MTIATIRGLALSSLIATLAPLSIMAQGPTNFVIPFDFTIGRKTLAAGNYRVTELLPHVLQFQSADYKSVSVITNDEEPGKAVDKVTLTFHKYGNEYIFAKMTNSAKGWTLPTSTHEKVLMEARTLLTPLDIVASTKR